MEKMNNENNNINFWELYRNFLENLDVSKISKESYKRALRRFLIFLDENNIKNPIEEDFLRFKISLKEKNLKPTSIKMYLISARIFFKWLDDNEIYKDITKRIKLEHVDKFYKKDPLTDLQVKNLLKVIDKTTVIGKRDYAMILLMTICGLRTIELVRLNIEDIRNIGNTTVLFVQGKGRLDKNDFVRLPYEVEFAIRDYLSCAGIHNSKEAIFQNFYHKKFNHKITTKAISDMVKENLKKIGINSDRITAHSLRHTAATLNMINGGSLQETQQLLRHKSINDTLVYCHNLDRLNNQSEQRISNMIFNATK